MKKRMKLILGSMVGVALICLIGISGIHAKQQAKPAVQTKNASSTTSTQTSSSSLQESTADTVAEASTPASTEEPTGDAAAVTYPDLSQYSELSVHVSIAEQTMTITSGQQTIFKTSVSTGAADSPTPTGTFVIEAERGNFFYNAESGEGAYYWVSFKDHGIYLFHSIPTDEQGNELPEEAAKLGTPSSHGCVRMPRETAKWFYEQIPEGITVTIE